jgi:hypothetical protein
MIHGARAACDGGWGRVRDAGGIARWDGQILAVWLLKAHPLQSILLWDRGVQALQCLTC